MEHNVVYIGNDRCRLYVGSSRRCVVTESALPYDAEIEYLRSDGYAYIDTGYNGNELLELTITIARFEETTSTMLCFWGWWIDGGNVPCFQLITQNNKIVAPTGRNSFSLSGISANTVWKQDVFYTFKATQTQISNSDRTAYLFARNLGAVSLVNPHIQIRQATIKRGGVLVRDYIAVRKGTTGYLYDKVSGQLFGNSGTGNFILGQDIVPIEYIQSSNTQWIDTGFKPNQDTSVYMTVLIPASNIISRFYETRNSAWNSEYALINFGQSDNQFQIRFGNNSRGTKLRNKLDINTTYTLFMDKNSVYLDGTLIGTAPTYTFQCNYNLPLFALNNAGTVTSASDCTYRLYNCKIYDNNVLIRDYIPVRAGTTGYLLDKLTGALYSNRGTGDFILGNDKT